MFFIREYDDFDNLIYSVCIKLSYYKGNYHDSFLCFDINFGIIINSVDFLGTKHSDFGVITITFADYLDYYFDFLTIYNTNRKKNK